MASWEEHRAEEMGVAETLTKSRSEYWNAGEHCHYCSIVSDAGLKQWVWWVGVCVALSFSQEFYHVFSQLNIDQESTHLEAAISILETMEGVAIAETLYYHVWWSVQSV